METLKAVFEGAFVALVLTFVFLLGRLSVRPTETRSGGGRTIPRHIPESATGTTASAIVPSPTRSAGFVIGGVVLVGVGLLVASLGVQDAITASQAPDVFGAGAAALADGASRLTWGIVILTGGAYVLRGARRRGGRDRLGRVALLVGYALLGAGMDDAIHEAVGLWAAQTEQAGRQVLLQTLVVFLAWGVPGALLVHVGTRLADEKILLTAEMTANF